MAETQTQSSAITGVQSQGGDLASPLEKKLLEVHSQLANLITSMAGKAGTEELLAKVREGQSLLEKLAGQQAKAKDGAAPAA